MDDSDIQELIQDLGSYNRKVREKAVEKLIEIGEPYLMDTLKDENMRSGIINALREISYNEEINYSAVVPALIEALKDKHHVVRRDAAQALVNICDERAVPALIGTLNDESWGVRLGATEALGRTAGKIADNGEYSSALKIIKTITLHFRKEYEKRKDGDSLRERRINLAVLSDLTQQIYDKMNQDKKFHKPVKHQSVRAVRKKVMTNG